MKMLDRVGVLKRRRRLSCHLHIRILGLLRQLLLRPPPPKDQVIHRLLWIRRFPGRKLLKLESECLLVSFSIPYERITETDIEVMLRIKLTNFPEFLDFYFCGRSSLRAVWPPTDPSHRHCMTRKLLFLLILFMRCPSLQLLFPSLHIPDVSFLHFNTPSPPCFSPHARLELSFSLFPISLFPDSPR